MACSWSSIVETVPGAAAGSAESPATWTQSGVRKLPTATGRVGSLQYFTAATRSNIGSPMLGRTGSVAGQSAKSGLR